MEAFSSGGGLEQVDGPARNATLYGGRRSNGLGSRNGGHPQPHPLFVEVGGGSAARARVQGDALIQATRFSQRDRAGAYVSLSGKPPITSRQRDYARAVGPESAVDGGGDGPSWLHPVEATSALSRSRSN